jgi:Helix-turn-helix domain
MSVEAISWALNLAPVPADRGGQPSSACKFVLVGLAHHAGPDGTGAFPSVATLVRYTGLSERTVRTCLDRLEAEGIIQPCDPDIVAARIKRADRRPKGWDLDLSRVRGDLTEAGIAALEHQFPGLAAMVTAIVRSDAGGAPDEVQSPHPVGAVDNWADQVRPLHPASGTGCNERTDGVQRAQPRGATVAPEPSREPSLEPPAATVRAREAARVGDVTAGGEPGLRVLRRPGQPLATHPHPAAQTHSGHHGCPGRGLDAARARGAHRSEHQRRAQPLRRPGRPALARRTALAAAAALGPDTRRHDRDRGHDLDGFLRLLRHPLLAAGP